MREMDMNWITWREHWMGLSEEGKRDEWRNLRQFCYASQSEANKRDEAELSLSDWFDSPAGFRFENCPSPAFLQQEE